MAAEGPDQGGTWQPAGGPVAPVDLDLAFSAAEGLSPELLQAAGAWCDPLEAEPAWQALLAGWLARLLPDLPPALRSGAYSLGLSLVDDAEIAALNADWRGKAGPTDVLAFAAQDEDLEQVPPLPLPDWMAAAGPTASDSLVPASQGACPHAGALHAADPEAADPAAAALEAGASDDLSVVDLAAADEGSPDVTVDLAGMPLELGDIVISVETAARQAPEHGHSLALELLFLASHGLLHLLGWDHPDEASLAAMLARQEALLAELHAPLQPD